MKHLVVLVCALACLASTGFAKAESPNAKPDQTIHFTDGSTAVSYFNCGDADLCARIADADGSTLSIYSEGAALCQPYILHFVKMNARGRTIFEFSRSINHTVGGNFSGGSCGHTVATQMVMNRGFVHMTVTETSEGTLDLKFSAAK
ncbi:MAG: hypothetical protein KGN02_00650 [bacterium]|nr:hypothetical protein [bacterium]